MNGRQCPYCENGMIFQPSIMRFVCTACDLKLTNHELLKEYKEMGVYDE